MDFARRNNYFYRGSDKNFRLVEVQGKEERFEILHTFEFNSDRKRASVIVRDHDGSIKLYIKGADSIIKKRLAPDQDFLVRIDQKVEQFSVQGLRTLLIAMKGITEKDYQELDQKITRAVDAPNRDKRIGIATSRQTFN